MARPVYFPTKQIVEYQLKNIIILKIEREKMIEHFYYNTLFVGCLQPLFGQYLLNYEEFFGFLETVESTSKYACLRKSVLVC